MEAIQFKNFSDKDFTWKYDGIPYTFKAGTQTYMEDFKAQHFAKHLIDRELTAKGVLTNSVIERAKLELLCFPSDAAVTADEAVNINEITKRKAGRPAKKVEEEFADLK